MNEPEISNDGLGEFVIYTTDDGRVEIHLRLIDGSVWLTQKEIAELFDVSRSSVSEHVKHLVNSGELDRGEVVRKFRKEPGHSPRSQPNGGNHDRPKHHRHHAHCTCGHARSDHNHQKIAQEWRKNDE